MPRRPPQRAQVRRPPPQPRYEPRGKWLAARVPHDEAAVEFLYEPRGKWLAVRISRDEAAVEFLYKRRGKWLAARVRLVA